MRLVSTEGSHPSCSQHRNNRYGLQLSYNGAITVLGILIAKHLRLGRKRKTASRAMQRLERYQSSSFHQMGTITFSRFCLSFGQFSFPPSQHDISEKAVVGVQVYGIQDVLSKMCKCSTRLGLPLFLKHYISLPPLHSLSVS